jgi:hypothetical protein
MRTAIGATAVNIAKPTNLGVPMIHAFLDNIRYITIELNGLILYDTRDDVPCDMDKWRETRARFHARWPVARLKRPTSETPGSDPNRTRSPRSGCLSKVRLGNNFLESAISVLMSHVADVNGHTVGQRIGDTRVSTVAQTLDQQNDALAKAGVSKTFSDTMSGHTGRAIARYLGVSRATPYRYLAV